MCFVIEIEDIFNEKRKGYLAHSDSIGDFVVEEIHNAHFFPQLKHVKNLLKHQMRENVLSIEDGDFTVSVIQEIEMIKKKTIHIEDL
jgi:hypothetical protein